MIHTVYIGLGSNLGDREENLSNVIDTLVNSPTFSVESISPYYESKALPTAEVQPDYINAVVKLSTELEPLELLEHLEDIEVKMGRERPARKWASRIIDIDILFYDDLVMNGERLTIPHPEAAKRWFVIRPLCDIDSSFLHPVLKKSVSELLGELKCSV